MHPYDTDAPFWSEHFKKWYAMRSCEYFPLALAPATIGNAAWRDNPPSRVMAIACPSVEISPPRIL
jgi:hypothetical protein